MKKPKCKLVGQDGNIYNLVAIASRTLEEAGQAENAKAMQNAVFSSKSYDTALCAIMKFVDMS